MWPAPNRDGDGSALPCDLFTPPTVELHNGSFRVKDPATASLHLIDLEEIPYRLRMEGFAVSMDGSVSAFIRDGETGRLHALRSGQRSKDGLFSLENCNFLCGEIFSRCATVRDWSDGKIYRLPFDGAAAATEFRAKLVSISAGGPLHCEANGIGDSVSHGGRDYEFISADGDSILIRERLADGPCVRLYLTALESHDSDLDGA
ncbi:MAG: hypothetical protein LBI39_04495 [Puniceicoccales bacterium]|nr:hypothetical protein [Puniceicoccales bacterium]